MKPLHLNRPHLLIVTGIPGSGKSAFSVKFAETFGAPIVSDKPLRDLPEPASAAVRHVAVDYQLEQIMLTNATVIVDSHTASRKQRANIIVKAKKAGYAPLVVWVQTDEATARRRATKRSRDPKQFVYTDEEFDASLKRFTAPTKIEPVVVISGKHTYASQAKVVLSTLASQRDRSARPSLQPPKRSGQISVR